MVLLHFPNILMFLNICIIPLFLQTYLGLNLDQKCHLVCIWVDVLIPKRCTNSFLGPTLITKLEAPFVNFYSMCGFPRIVSMVSRLVTVPYHPMTQGVYLLTWFPRIVPLVPRAVSVTFLPMTHIIYLLIWYPMISPVVSWTSKNIALFMIQ